jgi:hypothetical protein
MASCWTARRLRLRDWLEQTAPHLAPVYVGGPAAMVFDVDFPGRLVFVWRAIRASSSQVSDSERAARMPS